LYVSGKLKLPAGDHGNGWLLYIKKNERAVAKKPRLKITLVFNVVALVTIGARNNNAKGFTMPPVNHKSAAN
jgi:hypothetical protein